MPGSGYKTCIIYRMIPALQAASMATVKNPCCKCDNVATLIVRGLQCAKIIVKN